MADQLGEIEASLDEVRSNVAHADAQHNPWALQALHDADGLLVDYRAACREIGELKAALAAAEARGRQWAIDALRDQPPVIEDGVRVSIDDKIYEVADISFDRTHVHYYLPEPRTVVLLRAFTKEASQ